MNRLLLSAYCILITSFCQLHAQCISTFPYSESFEAGNGGWFSGGTGSDWALGQPSKNTITAAATGSNCWITGGLTGSAYNAGERSYVQSPCFDITGLQYPYFSLSIYWESEKEYDGSNLQYSTNGGVSWGNVKRYGKPVSCMNQNWFNNSSITNLNGLVGVPDGWSGNTENTQGSCLGGSGSGGWVTATQCMPLSGVSNLLFRVTFGAGTACNNYDGVAFDNIYIGEAPPNTADFTYTCNGNTVNFSGITSACPDTLLWTFSDGTTATGLNVSHTFTGGGTFTVNFYAGGPCNAPATITKQIQLIDVNTVVQDVSCNGYNDGAATVNVQPAGTYNYSWSTSPVQTTSTAVNLPAGDYAVTVSSPNTCATIAQVSIAEPNGITNILSATPDTCTGGGGNAQVLTTGGVVPYQYTWSNGIVNADSISNLNTGTYTVTTTDADGCSVSDSVYVDYLVGLDIEFSEVKNVSCYDERDAKISVAVNGGATPYTYIWSNNAISPTLTRLDVGTYVVSVIDANACSAVDSVIIEKEICPSYVYFPNGFSPNGDGINDRFRPKYSADLLKYNIRVYNRWGELVYESDDISEGWNGVFKGAPQPLGVYAWVSQYRFTDNELHQTAGNITLMK